MHVLIHHTPSLSLLVGLPMKWGWERVHETSSMHFESLRSQLLSHLLWQLTYLQGSRTYRQLLSFILPALEFEARGGGGRGYSPQILVGMCHGKVKKWQGLRNELPVESENGGLRNELEPFWAWKWGGGAPERAWAVLSVKLRGSGTAANLRRCRTLENANLRNGR